MKWFLLQLFILGCLIIIVQSYDRSQQKYACEGKTLYLDCPRTKKLQMLSANFGRTSKSTCSNQPVSAINCISNRAKTIIFRKCDNKMFCTVEATSAKLGDPCPGVRKYIDVIYKCVGPDPTPKDETVTTKRSFVELRSTEILSTTMLAPADHTSPTIEATLEIFNGSIIRPSETNIQETKEKRKDHGFFRSVFVLLVLLKDKLKHSLLSVLIGVAAGTVIVLITVLVCVCVEKRRRKHKSASFSDSNVKSGEAIELEKSELLARKESSNTDSARTDDRVDSAYCDDEIDKGVSNDYESASDIAYLDAYLDEYNKNKTLPKPPGKESQHSEPRGMPRRAHNDGSKGRSYGFNLDYNSNNDSSFTPFS